MSRRIRNFATLALLLSPLAAEAQSPTPSAEAASMASRSAFSPTTSSGAFGLDGFGTIGLDPQGIFSLKAELGYIRYNRKTEPFFASDGFSTFELESETTSGVLMLGAGPQLTMPTGPPSPVHRRQHRLRAIRDEHVDQRAGELLEHRAEGDDRPADGVERLHPRRWPRRAGCGSSSPSSAAACSPTSVCAGTATARLSTCRARAWCTTGRPVRRSRRHGARPTSSCIGSGS